MDEEPFESLKFVAIQLGAHLNYRSYSSLRFSVCSDDVGWVFEQLGQHSDSLNLPGLYIDFASQLAINPRSDLQVEVMRQERRISYRFGDSYSLHAVVSSVQNGLLNRRQVLDKLPSRDLSNRDGWYELVQLSAAYLGAGIHANPEIDPATAEPETSNADDPLGLRINIALETLSDLAGLNRNRVREPKPVGFVVNLDRVPGEILLIRLQNLAKRGVLGKIAEQRVLAITTFDYEGNLNRFVYTPNKVTVLGADGVRDFAGLRQAFTNQGVIEPEQPNPNDGMGPGGGPNRRM